MAVFTISKNIWCKRKLVVTQENGTGCPKVRCLTEAVRGVLRGQLNSAGYYELTANLQQLMKKAAATGDTSSSTEIT